MEFTNKQIKRILRIQDFVEMANTLSKVYIDFDNKEYVIDTFNDKSRIYKMYCSSIYNLIKAIQDSKDFFADSNRYKEFEKILSQKFIANDNRYYSKDNYESTFFKIIETIRHQVNHFTRDEEDNNILFEVNIDFGIIDNLRLVINDIFYELYNKIDKNKIKEIIFSKPKIKYSIDKLTNKMDELKSKINESDNTNNSSNALFKEYNSRALELLNELFNPNNLYELFSNNLESIKKLEESDNEVQKMFKEVEEYINKNGTDFEKEAIVLLKDYIKVKDGESIKDVNKSIQLLEEKMAKLKEKYNKN